MSSEDVFLLTDKYIKKIENTSKEKDIYDEEYQKESFANFKTKLIELREKLMQTQKTTGNKMHIKVMKRPNDR